MDDVEKRRRERVAARCGGTVSGCGGEIKGLCTCFRTRRRDASEKFIGRRVVLRARRWYAWCARTSGGCRLEILTTAIIGANTD